MNEKKQYAKVTELNGIPRLAEALPLALQHVVAMIVGCVTPAIILSGVTGLTPGDQVRLIQASLLISGLATLLQLFPPVRRCGSGLPVIMGASFAHVPLLIALGAQFGLPTILGAQLVGGVIAILVGLFYKKLSRIFTPLVTGTVVFTIGLSLYPTAITYMAGGAGAPDFGSPRNWFLAVLTLVIVIFFNYFTKGFCKLASILIGIICGYAAAFYCYRRTFCGTWYWCYPGSRLFCSVSGMGKNYFRNLTGCYCNHYSGDIKSAPAEGTGLIDASIQAGASSF